MLKAIIIEDERPALENLINVLASAAPDVEITACLPSVKQAISYLESKPTADLIFSDVQLSDGLSFEIFKKVQVKIPVIFITGFDEFTMNAFENNGIDYLLKPVDHDSLKKAVIKYKMLERHFSTQQPINTFLKQLTDQKKKRLLVRKGLENIPLRLEDAVLFYTENKIVYVIDKNGKKYMSDRNLGELEEMLDQQSFFRANRQYIININYIRGFKSFEKVKLQIDITLPGFDQSIIVSQETAPQFREWMYNA